MAKNCAKTRGKSTKKPRLWKIKTDSDILSIMNRSDRIQTNEIIDITENEAGNWILEYSHTNSLLVNTVSYQISQLTFKINQSWIFEMELP